MRVAYVAAVAAALAACSSQVNGQHPAESAPNSGPGQPNTVISGTLSDRPTPRDAPNTAGSNPDCGVYRGTVSRQQYVQDIRTAGSNLYEWDVAHAQPPSATREQVMDQWEML